MQDLKLPIFKKNAAKRRRGLRRLLIPRIWWQLIADRVFATEEAQDCAGHAIANENIAEVQE